MSQERSFERVNQKQRTRSELLKAATELTEKGMQPSVADAADHAGISRATAYRYFSNPEDMIREAVLDRFSHIVQPRLDQFGGDAAGVPAALIDLVQQIHDMVEGNEAMFRALLASSVTSGGRRGGRRVTWLGAVLAPLKPVLPAEEFDHLLYALCLVTGIETLVVLKDVCGLDERRAQDVTLWTARALLAGVLRQIEGQKA